MYALLSLIRIPSESCSPYTSVYNIAFAARILKGSWPIFISSSKEDCDFMCRFNNIFVLCVGALQIIDGMWVHCKCRVLFIWLRRCLRFKLHHWSSVECSWFWFSSWICWHLCVFLNPVRITRRLGIALKPNTRKKIALFKEVQLFWGILRLTRWWRTSKPS